MGVASQFAYNNLSLKQILIQKWYINKLYEYFKLSDRKSMYVLHVLVFQRKTFNKK